MGSASKDLITAEEAALMLEVTVGMIHKMTRNGLLTSYFERNGSKVRKLFRRDEIAAVASIRLKRLDLVTAMNVGIRALALSQSLEHRIDEISALLGLEGETLSHEEIDVVALHVEVQEALDTMNKPDAETVRHWATIFLSITEEYLRMVELFTACDDPWKDFLLLGEKLANEAPKNEFSHNRMLQAAYSFLEPARRHLRQVAYFYVRNHNGRVVANKKFPGMEKNLDETLINLMFLH